MTCSFCPALQARAVELKPLDMGQLVPEALRQLAREAAAAGAEVILPDSWKQALGHAPWVGEIWLNYLSNALKYCDPPVRLELGSNSGKPGWCRFWVRDNGRSLSASEREKLFVPFSRLHQNSREGHGLGLTIVRRIAECMGGETGVEAPKDGGNLFFFTLPEDPNISNK